MKVSPLSGSVVEKCPTCAPAGWFSSIADGAQGEFVGVSFTFVTVIVNCCSKNRLPLSVVRTRTE